jgi:hypothetical protein
VHTDFLKIIFDWLLNSWSFGTKFLQHVVSNSFLMAKCEGIAFMSLVRSLEGQCNDTVLTHLFGRVGAYVITG